MFAYGLVTLISSIIMLIVNVKHVQHVLEMQLDITLDGKDVFMRAIVVFATTLYALNVMLSMQIRVQSAWKMQMILPFITTTASVTALISNISQSTSVHVMKHAMGVPDMINIPVWLARMDGINRPTSHGA